MGLVEAQNKYLAAVRARKSLEKELLTLVRNNHTSRILHTARLLNQAYMEESSARNAMKTYDWTDS